MIDKKMVSASFEDVVDVLVCGAIYEEGNDTEFIQPLRLQEDRTLRTYTLDVGLANGSEAVVLLEDNGSPRVMLYGYDGAAEQRLRTEVSRELATSLYGTNVSGAVTPIENEDTGELRNVPLGSDEAGNLDRLRTDPNRIPWGRTYEGYVQVDPVEIPVAEGVLWNPGATAAELYEVSFKIVNNDAGGAPITGIYIGVDIGAGGGLAAPEYWMFDEAIPYPGNSAWRYGGVIAGDDDVRGVAAVANDASIHWSIRRLDVGA